MFFFSFLGLFFTSFVQKLLPDWSQWLFLFLVKLLVWAMIKSQAVLKRNFWTVFFNLLNHRWVLEQNLYFCRTHFGGYFSCFSYLNYKLKWNQSYFLPSFRKLNSYLLIELLTDSLSLSKLPLEPLRVNLQA